MEIREQNQNFTLPLALYEVKTLAEATLKDGTECVIRVGLSEDDVQQLKALSLDETDEAIQNLTSDRKRFGEGSYEAWYSKGRVPFSLLDKHTGKLAALVWLGPAPLRDKDDNWHTIAYRSYHPYRGKGVMKRFTGFALDSYAAQYPGSKFWAGIHTNNAASAGLAEAIGFVKSETYSTPDEIIMVKE